MEKNQTLKTIVYTKKSGLATYVGRYRFSFNGKEKDDEVKGYPSKREVVLRAKVTPFIVYKTKLTLQICNLWL